MPARLYDFGDCEMLWVVCLQMRGDQAHTSLEYLQRHPRLDPGPLNPAANRDTMIAIQRPQERCLPGAVPPVNDPAVAGTHFQRDFLQRQMLVQVYGRLGEAREKTRRACASLAFYRRDRCCFVVLCVQPALDRKSVV